MPLAEVHVSAIDCPNHRAEIGGRQLAYRSIGVGKPIVLCPRFRGNMDTWDPAFLDALALQGFRVITFDCTGTGLSTGTKEFGPVAMARDAADLMQALQLEKVVIAGWSLGGMAAQIVLAMYPDRISHAVLIGSTPPGPAPETSQQLFYDTARFPEYTLEHETILFFDPTSTSSCLAAAHSHERIAERVHDRSVPVDAAWSIASLGGKPSIPPFPADDVLEVLKTTTVPILHVGGSRDIACPVANWHALNQLLPTMHLLTFPQTGHGPHHQHPWSVARHMAAFTRQA